MTGLFGLLWSELSSYHLELLPVMNVKSRPQYISAIKKSRPRYISTLF